ncbi:MAG: S41 family peptidase [Candidatus Omnitrophica bacterium]|nr:S41 family peptidase [Candidatus Omnitrophota bacterium]
MNKYLFTALYRGALIALIVMSTVYIRSEAKPYNVDYKALLNPTPDPAFDPDAPYVKPYLDFMKEVFDKMDAEYYKPVSQETYRQFASSFTTNVLSRLKDKQNVVKEIKYTGAGLLVQKLKDPQDTFSGFLPPKEAEEFKSSALGYELGIGLSGAMTDHGYVLYKVELRSDSYAKGIRAGDILLKINNVDVKTLNEEALKAALFPPLDTVVPLEILVKATGRVTPFNVKVIEFFKETLASVPTGIPGMSYIKINQFNEKTGEDFTRLMNFFIRQGMDRLIIDLRGNGGGPPLAAREIASLFFQSNTELIYFQRKNRPKVGLKTIPEPFLFKGRIAILIDKGTGSASELFAGTLRRYDRAILIGTERSAGKTFLKSMYYLEDKSMLYLITSLAYLFNGETFDPAGLKPDFTAPGNADLFKFVAKCFDTYYAK